MKELQTKRGISEDLCTSKPGELRPLSDAQLQAIVKARQKELDSLIKKIIPPYTPPETDPLGR
ncbi:hypothetical protein HY408_02150 [Candidatus Gottesmanbacteria bacterium]|nr:hypothetical protein [Candidatus Gottesmanbacteria bacterium]